MNKNLILLEEMKQLGLNQYESKAYLKLLEEYPLNGYLLSKKSGVPRSRIYEVIDNLINKEILFEKKEENGSVYYPLEPRLLISNLKKDYGKILEHVEEETKKLYNTPPKTYEYKIIVGRNKIFNMINTLISTAEKRIDISIWEEEYKDLSNEFDNAIKRGVKVKGIYFGQTNPFTDVLTHRRMNTYLKEKAERYIIVVVDDKEAISGIISRGEESQISWTDDIGVIDISKDYIVHDLMINVYSNNLEEHTRKRYEASMDKVRTEYFK